MRMSVWILIPSLFLISTNGEIHETISKSFYENSDSSTPKPNQRLLAMNEYVLYLTPTQAQALEAAGAIVKPLPQLENALKKQMQKQSTKDHAISQEQNISSDEEFQLDMSMDEFYKALNDHHLTDASQQSETTEKSTVKPRLKYKYSAKPRQEYGSSYVQKKNNKTKSSSTEYVRYFPNYETHVLKMEPYRAQLLNAYYLEDQTDSATAAENNQKSGEIKKPEDTVQRNNLRKQKENPDFEAPIEIQKPIEVQKPVNNQENFGFKDPVEIDTDEDIPRHKKNPNQEEIRSQQQIALLEDLEKPGEYEKNEEVHKPVEIEKLLDNPKILELKEQEESQKTLHTKKQENIETFEEIQRPEEIHEIEQIPTRIFSIGRGQNQQPTALAVETSMNSKGPVTFDGQVKDPIQDQESEKNPASLKIETPPLNPDQEKVLLRIPVSPPAVDQMQYSRRVAPQLQDEIISDGKAQHTELINNQRAIQTKLKELNSEEEYTIELDKLRQNLEKQNILAKKLATQHLLKKSQDLNKEDSSLQSRLPLELVRGHEPSPIIIPRPYPVSWGIGSPIPVPVLQPEKEEEAVAAISIPGPRNFYTNVHTPYLTQVVAPENVKHETQYAYPFDNLENLSILRPVWEH